MSDIEKQLLEEIRELKTMLASCKKSLEEYKNVLGSISDFFVNDKKGEQ